MANRIFLLCYFLCLSVLLPAQAPEKPTSGDIHAGIKKLGFLGSALYVAAHPDDENTAMISYLANARHAEMAYLSMTRGDGGQNLIGPEIQELLGLIRTQELLAARSVDGGNQFFTRANDFGYSKHPDETFNIWNKEDVLADAVWTIRKWRPDVIINRFDHRTPGTTHGHHTGSAIISVEAFDLAADPNAFPEQLEYVSTWQPRRLFWNTSWFFYGSREAYEKAMEENESLTKVDVGVYYPLKGKSNTEISAESRSMHKCQGFGSSGRRGAYPEYLELIKGEFPARSADLFDGINTTWTRVGEEGRPIGELVARIDREFRHDDPAASVPDLLQVHQMIAALPDGHWKTIKLAETEALIKACLGLFVEVVAGDFSATNGETITLSAEAVNRSDVEVVLESVTFKGFGKDTILNASLENNNTLSWEQQLILPAEVPYTNPYWLNETGALGMYRVDDQSLRGLPETPRELRGAFQLKVNGVSLVVETPVVFKRTDPVKGEFYRPFEVTPPAFAAIEDPVYIFTGEKPQEVNVTIKAGKANVAGTLSLEVPQGWRVVPAAAAFELTLKGEERTVSFTVTPPVAQSEGTVRAVLSIDGKAYDKEMITIEYDHIPVQTVLRDAQARIVNIDLKTAGERIGYVMGAGDVIPASLEQIGYQVDILDGNNLDTETLDQYDAIIMGVRAYNTLDRLKFYQSALMDYVQRGGTMIVQYNTNRGLTVPMNELGPYPFRVSRDRVSVEEAEVRFLQPDHPVLNHPNKITRADFEGWVQERGLYFPDQWDDAYQAILSANDPGETPKDGGLLVAQYGKGYYIYTGYSWFRELPAGVPGAFRLFANLISIGKMEK